MDSGSPASSWFIIMRVELALNIFFLCAIGLHSCSKTIGDYQWAALLLCVARFYITMNTHTRTHTHSVMIYFDLIPHTTAPNSHESEPAAWINPQMEIVPKRMHNSLLLVFYKLVTSCFRKLMSIFIDVWAVTYSEGMSSELPETWIQEILTKELTYCWFGCCHGICRRKTNME